ncbi:hypothetical protein F5879DRAFT_977885, partial [Lentinula edodes]
SNGSNVGLLPFPVSECYVLLRFGGRYDWLEEKGYMMRPRYRPGWKASWLDKPHSFQCAEDALVLPCRCMDARRTSDSQVVALKRVKSSSDEARISKMFSSQKHAENPANHCIPLLDVLQLSMRTMYSDQYHPADLSKKYDWSGEASYESRTCHPPRYYLIDFGFSKIYDPGEERPPEEPIMRYFGFEVSIWYSWSEILETACEGQDSV